MSSSLSGPVTQILFRTAIGCANDMDHLRIYTQDTSGAIRESVYESGWSNGTAKNVISKAKLCSPIAVTSRKLEKIRVYSISDKNTIIETCYDSTKGWYDGALTAKNFEVAPYSQLGAIFLATEGNVIRVYGQQTDNTIQEFAFDGNSQGWYKDKNLGQALPGTSIAATSYAIKSLEMRVYFQDVNLSIIEWGFTQGNNPSWSLGQFTVKSAFPRTAISCLHFVNEPGKVGLRIYYIAEKDGANQLLEKANDGGWVDGGLVEKCIPGSQISCLTWGTLKDLSLRVYFQNGTKVSGVSEWVWNRGWSKGVDAIPPA